MPSLGIVSTGRAYLPEVQAYLAFFRANGVFCREFSTASAAMDSGCQAILVFYGLYPRWMKRPELLIVDVNSRSVGRASVAKDFIKLVVNHKPDVRICQNDYVCASPIGRGAPIQIRRPMGFFEELIAERSTIDFDIVYSGTTKRRGLLNALARLADIGLKVCLVGQISSRDISSEILVTGHIGLQEVYEIYSRSRLGLNFVPDIAPLNRQESTKLIEYCAAGLGVITTDYEWVRKFERQRNGRFLRWRDDLSPDEVRDFPYVVPEVFDRSWEVILGRSQLIKIVMAQLGHEQPTV